VAVSSPRSSSVAVLGSANLDVVVTVPRFPAPGETVLGTGLVEIAGGKGLNQVVAAGRHGPAALVACVGTDEAGRLLTSHAERAGVDTRYVSHADLPTGRAFIQLAPDGENCIVVAAAANARLSPDDVRRSLPDLAPDVVLAQLEIPLECVLTAAEWAREARSRFVLNASPTMPLPEWVLGLCDPLIVNTGEAAQISGVPTGSDISVLVRALLARAATVVVTDGPRGAHVGSATGIEHVPGQRVSAVDTTGAGDEFAGRLAAALAAGHGLAESARLANAAAARVVALPRSAR
jgi:ribokinase